MTSSLSPKLADKILTLPHIPGLFHKIMTLSHCPSLVHKTYNYMSNEYYQDERT